MSAISRRINASLSSRLIWRIGLRTLWCTMVPRMSEPRGFKMHSRSLSSSSPLSNLQHHSSRRMERLLPKSSVPRTTTSSCTSSTSSFQRSKPQNRKLHVTSRPKSLSFVKDISPPRRLILVSWTQSTSSRTSTREIPPRKTRPQSNPPSWKSCSILIRERDTDKVTKMAIILSSRRTTSRISLKAKTLSRCSPIQTLFRLMEKIMKCILFLYIAYRDLTR